VEGLAGGRLALNAAPLYFHYRLLVGVETETGFAAKSCAPTTMNVVSQVLGQGRPTPNHLADGGERRHPGLGLRQLRLARLPWMGLAMTHEGLGRRLGHCDNSHLIHSDLLEE